MTAASPETSGFTLPDSAMRLLAAWHSKTELGRAHPVRRTPQIDVRHSSDHPTGNSIKPAPT